MKTIDRYIIGKFLKAFLFTALLFSMISIVLNLAEKLDDFISNKVGIVEVLAKFYGPWVLFINGMLWPLFALISVIFFTSRIAKNAEILSFLNSGASLARILLPYLISGGLIAAMHLWLNHQLIPNANKQRIPFENTIENKSTRTSRHLHMMVSPNTKLYIQQYNTRDSSINNMRLEKYNGTQLLSFLEARKALWVDSLQIWRLTGYVLRDFTNPTDHGFKRNFGSELDTFFNILPGDIVQIRNQHQMMNSLELRTYIQNQRSRGVGGTRPYETELYRRSADPFSILILALIGFSVAARKVRGGIGLHLAVGIGVGAIFILVGRFSLTFTNAEAIGPFLGVWLPNIIFSIIAIVLFNKAQR